MGGPRPARRAVRALAAPQLGVLLAQTHRQLDHARVGRYGPAVGVSRLRRGGRVVVAGDAHGPGAGAAVARLAAGSGDDAAGAFVLLADLPARRGPEPAIPARLAGVG